MLDGDSFRAMLTFICYYLSPAHDHLEHTYDFFQRIQSRVTTRTLGQTYPRRLQRFLIEEVSQ